jgi:histone RNA hairpin-binding protein
MSAPSRSHGEQGRERRHDASQPYSRSSTSMSSSSLQVRRPRNAHEVAAQYSRSNRSSRDSNTNTTSSSSSTHHKRDDYKSNSDSTNGHHSNSSKGNGNNTNSNNSSSSNSGSSSQSTTSSKPAVRDARAIAEEFAAARRQRHGQEHTVAHGHDQRDSSTNNNNGISNNSKSGDHKSPPSTSSSSSRSGGSGGDDGKGLKKEPKDNDNTKSTQKSKSNHELGSEPEHEDDARRLEQRQKQIDIGKNSIAYDRYLREVPKYTRDHSKRLTEHPVTPNKSLKYGKRQWDGKNGTYRLPICVYYPSFDS